MSDINENDVLILSPVSIKKMTEDYLIIKKKDSTILTTPKAGARVVKLIESGKSVVKIKESISGVGNSNVPKGSSPSRLLVCSLFCLR